jgi:GntR family negative regulator for fad regulon and positive regulator of fabA
MKNAYKYVEQQIISGILSKELPEGSSLKSIRELARSYDVSRLVVHDALQRLAEFGWITLQKRRPPIINSYWKTGNINILGSIIRNEDVIPVEIIEDLLEIRLDIAPAYTRLAVANDNSQVIACLSKAKKLGNNPIIIAKFDWELQVTLALLSGNRIYTLFLNSFSDLYFKICDSFFAHDSHCEIVLRYYQKLMHAAINDDPDEAEKATRLAMQVRLNSFRKQVHNTTREENNI